MDRSVNLKGMSVKAAFQLAISQSNKTQEEIMDQMGWSQTVTSRFFSLDGYLPTYSSIPKLCRVLGNTVIVDWLNSNIEKSTDVYAPLDSRELLLDVAKLAEQFGNIASECRMAAEDNNISQNEAKRILKKVRIVSKELSNFYFRLDPILYNEED